MTNDLYGENKALLDNALRQMFTRIELLHDYLETSEGDNPIRHYCGRVKNAQSMTEKLKRRNLEPTFENAITKVTDLIGVRIICGFVEDVYLVADAIKASSDVVVIEEKDYIAAPKPNGYRSYHLIVRVKLCAPGKTICLPIEIQIRTIAQDSWAELEHTMKYKKEIRSRDLIQKELKRCADEMASADLCLQTIRQMIKGKLK